MTGVPDTFAAAPPGSRASAIWTHRVPSLFLDTFGRPDPNQDPPCERTSDTTVVQALHLMNAPDLHKKVTSDAGRAARLAKAARNRRARSSRNCTCSPTAGSRPTRNRPSAMSLFAGPEADRRAAVEDLLWALLNSAEFVFKD